jgi:hypothetical protein
MPVGLLKIERDQDRIVYFVHPSLHGEIEALTEAMLYTFITTQGVVGLWPITLSERENSWLDSNHAAARRAMHVWLRVASNKNSKSYEMYEALGKLSDPEWPVLSFSDLLLLAFKDHYIGGRDHLILQKLRGEVE